MAPKQPKMDKKEPSTSTGTNRALMKFTQKQIDDMMMYRRRLGEGSFAVVYSGKWQKKEVAIKTYKDGFIPRWKTEMRFYEEMKKYDPHPHIVDCLGYCGEVSKNDQEGPYLVLECIDFKLNDKREGLDWQTTIQILIQATKAVQYINCVGKMIIADLKPDAILLDKEFNVKLVDFNMFSGPNKYAAVLNKTYAAPEVIRSSVAHATSDVWSIGIIMLELLMDTVTEEYPSSSPKGKRRTHISTIARDLHTKGKLKVAEGLVNSGCNKEIAEKITGLAIDCIKDYFLARPKIEDVLGRLQKIQALSSSDKGKGSSSDKGKGSSSDKGKGKKSR